MEPQSGKATECSKLSGFYCESWTFRVLRETQSMEAWLVDFQREVKTLSGFFDLFELSL